LLTVASPSLLGPLGSRYLYHVFIEFLPLMLGAALARLYPIVVLLLLLGEGRLRTAIG
jgi:hypothetical protein